MSGQRTKGGGRRLRGVMINCAPAQCSIYESGVMFWNALRGSREYDLEYREVHHFTQIPRSGFDFLVFNYHHTTLRWLDTRRLAEIPGVKLAFVLEMTATDPFAFCPREDFDAYLVPDPTHRCADPRVFAVPRPLEATPALAPHVPKAVPWIGSFGFATPGKGFEQVVTAVNAEFEQALVRINIPFATHADASGELSRRYAEACRALAKPGIEVRVTHDYLDKDGVIRWCAENTLNVFLYERNQTGLAATTDQAIVSGRPLAVSRCDTFRHVHQHLPPYPERSLRAAIAHSEPEVARMRELWSAAAFQRRFAEVLGTLAPRLTGAHEGVDLVYVRDGERDANQATAQRLAAHYGNAVATVEADSGAGVALLARTLRPRALLWDRAVPLPPVLRRARVAEVAALAVDVLDPTRIPGASAEQPAARWNRVLGPEDRHELGSDDLAGAFVARAVTMLHEGPLPARVLRLPEDAEDRGTASFDFVVVDGVDRDPDQTIALATLAARTVRPGGHVLLLWRLAAWDSPATWRARTFEERALAALGPCTWIDAPAWDVARARPDALGRRSCLATLVVQRPRDAAPEGHE